MPLHPELREAYEKALYVVLGEPELVIRIGEPNRDLDELLDAEGARTAAFISAGNPGSAIRADSANDVAYVALLQSQEEAGYACHPGEGRDPKGAFPTERSALVIGISRQDAERVGRVFEQSAIVFIEKGKAPELVVLV